MAYLWNLGLIFGSSYAMLGVTLEVSRVTIEEYRKQLRWTRSKLAHEAQLDYQTVMRAERGAPVQYRTLEAIAAALSRGLGKEVRPADLDSVQISGL
jgi:transcriptional regulator with XRE-family HTH domain